MSPSPHPWPDDAYLLTALAPDNQSGGGGAFVDQRLMEQWGLTAIALTTATSPSAIVASRHRSLTEIPLQVSGDPKLRGLVAARMLLRREPYPVAKLRHFAKQWDVASAALVEEGRSVVASSFPSLILARAAGVPVVGYVAHNCEWKIAEQHPSRLIRREWRRILELEKRLIGDAHVWAVAETDASELAQRLGRPVRTVQLLRLGNEADVRPLPAPRSMEKLIIGYIGSYSWAPNARDIDELIERILPALRARGIDAELRLAGRGTEAIDVPGVRSLGEVDDVADFYAEIDVTVVPRPPTSTGVSIKIVEALEHGVPVVTTLAAAAAVGASPLMLTCSGSADIEDRLISLRRAQLDQQGASQSRQETD